MIGTNYSLSKKRERGERRGPKSQLQVQDFFISIFISVKQIKPTCTCQSKNYKDGRELERAQGGKKRKGQGGDAVKVIEGLGGRGGGQEELDAVKCLSISCIAVNLRRTALLPRRSCSDVCARKCLQLVQLLRQFSQHTGAEVGAALGQRPFHAVREGTHKTHAENRLIDVGKHAGNISIVIVIVPSFVCSILSTCIYFSCTQMYQKIKVQTHPLPQPESCANSQRTCHPSPHAPEPPPTVNPLLSHLLHPQNKQQPVASHCHATLLN